MSGLHVSFKIHSLDGLERAQATGKAFLACMGGNMSFQVARVPMHLKPTELTFTEDTFAMKLFHVSEELILVSKRLETGCTVCRLPRLAVRGGNRALGRGSNGRGSGNGS